MKDAGEAGQLSIIGGKRSHETLHRALGEHPPCRVLDVPTGTGVLAVYLRDLGFDVHCADIDPGNFEAASGLPFQSVDLNRGLPYEDASFDALVCANGLHRLFNHAGAISEFHRILRPGGSLFISVNHYASLDRRLRFLFTGSIDNNLDSPQFVQTLDVPEANVRQPLLYPFLANLLEAQGFEIESLEATQVRRRQFLLVPLAWLIRLGSLLVKRKTARSSRLVETRSRALLPGGRYFTLKARRRP